jgi:hypothetical protein
MGQYTVFGTGYVVVALYLATWLLISWRLRFLRGRLDGGWSTVEIFSADPRKTIHAIKTLYSPLPSDRLLSWLAWMNRVLFPVGLALVVYLFATMGREA